MREMYKIYLDDERIPIENDWIVVKNFFEFKKTIDDLGFDRISSISLDHDLGETAVEEYYRNAKSKNKIDYSNIDEKTGMDCCKFLVNKSLDDNKPLPTVYVHSKNPVGSENMMSYINNYLLSCGLPQSCTKIIIPHTLDEKMVERDKRIKEKVLKNDTKDKY